MDWAGLILTIGFGIYAYTLREKPWSFVLWICCGVSMYRMVEWISLQIFAPQTIIIRAPSVLETLLGL